MKITGTNIVGLSIHAVPEIFTIQHIVTKILLNLLLMTAIFLSVIGKYNLLKGVYFFY